jgi:hypothetical protein
MKKYLSAILLFDVLFPALILGIPGALLILASMNFQSFADAKKAEFSQYESRIRQVAGLERELQPVQAKMPLLRAVLSNNDIEARSDQSIQGALEKFSPDEIEQTLHDFQFGPSTIGENLGEGPRLSLKFSSRWEPLNAAALQWETAFPNFVLESLSIRRIPGSKTMEPYLESTFSYFVITEN